MKDGLSRLALRVKWLLRYNGLVGILPPVVALILPFVRKTQWFADWKEDAFDRRFGVTTSGFIAGSDIDFDADAQNHTEGYAPTSAANFGVILDELDIDHREYTFVDLGSGKGRALFMAALFPFSQVIGVELSPSFCEIAHSNIEQFKRHRTSCRDIQCIELDATKLDWPATPLVIYLLNPFDEHILSRVLERLRSSWESQPRDMIVIYLNPFFRELFDTSSFWHALHLKHGDAPDGWAVFRSVERVESVAARDDLNQPTKRSADTIPH